MRTRLLSFGAALLAPIVLVVPAAVALPSAVLAGHVREVIAQSVPTPTPGQSDVVVQSQVAASSNRPGFAAAVTEEGLQTTSGGTFGVAIGLAVTRDGGRSWTSRVVPGVTVAAGGDWLGVSWPTVAVAADGSIYVVASVRSADPCHQGLGVTRSADGGATFGPLVLVQVHTTCGVLEGRSSLAIDDGEHSPNRGRLYLAWTSYRSDKHGVGTGQVQTLSSSPAGGTDWSAPVDVTATDSRTFGNTLLVGPDGQLTDVYADSSRNFAKQYLKAATSTDGGRTFTAPVTVTNWGVATVGGANVRCCVPGAGIDPVTGEIYAVLADPRFRDGTYDDAVLFRSPDGVSWSTAKKVDMADEGAELLTPEVAAYDGSVYVTWTQSTGADGTAVRQQVTESFDGGRTFGPPVDAGRRGDLHYAALASGFGYYLGDVAGIAAVPGRAYLAWPLPTTPPGDGPQHQTLYVATVTSR